MAGLSLRGVTFRAGGREIVSGVDLDVAAGETVALLGPSGCGKTTLLRLIAGLERPTAGVVTFDGVDQRGIAPHRRGFGFMFQDHALFPHLNVARNVEFGLVRAGWERGRRATRVAELLELVGLAGMEKRTIEKLSGGERQRVALARALAPEPKVLMLDEPLGSLDRALRERLVGELAEILRRLQIPAIYVTHDQYEAFAVADRLAIMRAGRIMRAGPPREVWEHPGSEFVARFLGQENIVDAEIGDGVAVTPFGEFAVPGARAGAARVLLGEEGASLERGPGPNVATGTVEAVVFRGAEVVVRVVARGAAAEFTFASTETVPAAGEPVHVRVQRVEPMAPNEP